MTNGVREPLLRPRSFYGALVQYYRVRYGIEEQERALNTALETVSRAMTVNSRGDPQGPWMNTIADMIARDASELLLDLVVSFKRSAYAKDEEWRLVIRPGEVLASSAPTAADHKFDLIVRSETTANKTRRFVELYLPKQTFSSVAPMSSPIPFCAIHINPFKSSADAKDIRVVLDENGGVNIPLRPTAL